MASESDDLLDERLESLTRRAQNLRDLLKDGEEVTVSCADGELHVAESYRSKLERQYPKLYGRLLSIDAQMGLGLSTYAFGLVLAGVLVFGLQVGWWEGLLGDDVNTKLNAVWFYVCLPLLALFVVHLAGKVWLRWVYRRHRPGLLALIADAKLDRDVLLVMLRDEPDLDAVIDALKLDAQ